MHLLELFLIETREYCKPLIAYRPSASSLVGTAGVKGTQVDDFVKASSTPEALARNAVRICPKMLTQGHLSSAVSAKGIFLEPLTVCKDRQFYNTRQQPGIPDILLPKLRTRSDPTSKYGRRFKKQANVTLN